MICLYVGHSSSCVDSSSALFPWLAVVPSNPLPDPSESRSNCSLTYVRAHRLVTACVLIKLLLKNVLHCTANVYGLYCWCAGHCHRRDTSCSATHPPFPPLLILLSPVYYPPSTPFPPLLYPLYSSPSTLFPVGRMHSSPPSTSQPLSTSPPFVSSMYRQQHHHLAFLSVLPPLVIPHLHARQKRRVPRWVG